MIDQARTHKAKPHRAKKKFGQNFLHDQGIIEQILHSIHVHAEDHVLEIGPGKAALSEPLLLSAQRLKVVEIDRDLIPQLDKHFTELCSQLPEQAGQWQIINQDALTLDLASLQEGKKLRVVGNLPYNISTPLLFHFIQFLDSIEDMHFMLQKEVVDRIAAEPNNKNYGRLSIILQYFCACQHLFDVPPESFDPQPKVDSSIIRLVPHQELPFPCDDVDLLIKLVKHAFAQRRKTLRNNLRSWDMDFAFEEADIDPSLRPENISVAEYVKLCNILYHHTQVSAKT